MVVVNTFFHTSRISALVSPSAFPFLPLEYMTGLKASINTFANCSFLSFIFNVPACRRLTQHYLNYSKRTFQKV